MMQIVRSCKRFSKHFVFLKLQLMSLQKDRRYKFLWDTSIHAVSLTNCLFFSIAFCFVGRFLTAINERYNQTGEFTGGPGGNDIQSRSGNYLCIKFS